MRHFDYQDGDTLRNNVDEGGAYPVRWTRIDWIPTYCTQNEGDCRTCSLASDGFDCAGHHYRKRHRRARRTLSVVFVK